MMQVSSLLSTCAVASSDESEDAVVRSLLSTCDVASSDETRGVRNLAPVEFVRSQRRFEGKR